MADRLTRWGVVSLLLMAAVPVCAQSVLADPTRPPPGIAGALPEAGGVTGPVLQSVVIPKKGKPFAVIGGQQVRLGEMYGESRLIRLSEREAVLQGATGTERLKLTPGIEKTNIISKSPAAKPAQRGSKP